jgi:hypothetical protein
LKGWYLWVCNGSAARTRFTALAGIAFYKKIARGGAANTNANTIKVLGRRGHARRKSD